MIVIAFDFGLKNIGVAVGENILKKGRALSKLSAQNGSPDWDNVKNLLQTWKPKFLVVGLPLNIDGTRQDMTKKAEKFAYSLKYKFNLFVDLHDERLSTKEARSLIFKKNGFKGLKKEKIHSVAAVIILESWFNQNLY
ncbi:Holliday junction resolvase RuvX [Buchnera aphidicola (Rhopalosiphum padi)]|uniref:Putative pre-16S rRNA nuclease n=1 Tax=Buchnera aphidicola subsp. Rhopalosiphum padi TaxID=98793 RepID=A0A4D6Y7C3_BUCRP|nr:Holliday junction resolvase RuvX [Buchnera aphidicola]QCI25169.1 Holliday junction resolvase RuvX [Buchnera aphidicola (Rhopalosiphum padi)]